MAIAPIKYDGLSANYTPNWLLEYSEYPPTGSHFEYLINGETAFLRLYNEIMSAKDTIDIAIWGFQPSMFFKRDGKARCIGELLAQKAKDGVRVRVLVWSMRLIVEHAQTYMTDSTNLGRSKNTFRNVPGTTNQQHAYDLAWYYAVGFDKYNNSAIEISQKASIEKHLKTHPMCKNINELRGIPQIKNLMFRIREVEKQSDVYVDQNVSWGMEKALTKLASHHQKTVLIDYCTNSARGFILEHNMLDGYWDTNSHSRFSTQPDVGKNSPTPLQDHSSFLRGPILHHINHNFCQSWMRVTKDNLLKRREDFKAKNNITKQNYLVKNPIAIQALRTYDQPNIEDIKRIYLKNISKTTSYIYTENQYFRWPPLVQAFKEYWQDMKAGGRGNKDPIYWFVVTNASDTGIGSGTANADRMFAALGRQDVMPNVAINNNPEIKKRYEKIEPMHINRGYTQDDLKKYEEMAKKFPKAKEDLVKSLKIDLSKEIGIKCHICVLHSMDSDPKKWQEIYIHSKVTMINDVFLTMGSANINTRSMQGDTEMNLALEHGETVKKMRRAIWSLNTKSPTANPESMHLNSTSKVAFKEWQFLIDDNSKRKEAGLSPKQPLTEFLRLSPKVSNID